uniref:Uncharacterized protein n=1 Tax=Monodon monoceros TaxID=40151 RepID=A0A8C6BZQ9_MONMO
MGTEQSKEPSGGERYGRAAPGWLCPRHLGPLHPATAPFWPWKPVLVGSSGQSPSTGPLGWLPLCILRRHRAVEPGGHGSPSLPSQSAAAGRRPFCVPRIILTECAPKPPSPPEARLEEPGLRTTPTPRPRSLAGSGRGWDNPQAPPGLMAEVSQPGNSSMLEKEGAALKRLGTGSYSPEKGGAGVPCSRGPAPDRTQEPSTAETYPEETLKDSGHDAQPCSGDCRGQRAAGLGCTGRGATTQRMDSLEETLRELEATLSQMGTAPAAGSPGSPPPPPPGPQVAASCPILSSYLPAPYSCDHLPAGCPERSSPPGLPHRSLKPSSPSSLQSQGSGSGSQPDGSSLRRPLTQDQRGLSPQPLLDKTLLRLVAPGCGRGLYACLPATPLPSSASFPLLSSPTCSLGSPLSSQPPS